MIQRKPDGVTLFYTDAAGLEVTANPLNGARYFALLTILSAQTQASRDNEAAEADYRGKLANYQANLDAGRPAGLLPAKPLKKSVSDFGVTAFAAFDPALPDPKVTVQVPSSGGLHPDGQPDPPPDRLDVVLQLLMLINSKLDAKA